MRSLTFPVILLAWVICDEVLFAEPPEVKRQWIVITAPQFRQALTPLIRQRTQQGFHVTIHESAGDEKAKKVQDLIAGQCKDFSGKSYVLLVGDWARDRGDAHLPAALGTHGRMSGKWTDHGYGMPDRDGATTVAVGRFPARSSAEIQAMVAKTLRFERQEFGPWTNRVELLVGHPGGKTTVEKQAAELVIRNAVGYRLTRLHPRWQAGCIVDMPNSPFSAGRDGFGGAMSKALARGNLIACYAGHSSAGGIFSSGKTVLSTADFTKLKIVNSSGIFVTTGCYACQIKGFGETGFAIANVRNPHGSAAVIGAFAESYAAPGQLALDGMIGLLNQDHPPQHLGEYWLGVQAGLARAKMNPVTFWLYDMADGSGGKVPLGKQRKEHLEMWTLLGDPAMRLPLLASTLDVQSADQVEAGSDLKILVRVKDNHHEGALAKVTIESRYVPTVGGRQKEAATLFGEVIGKAMATVMQGQIRCKIPLPKQLRGKSLTVRVIVLAKDGRDPLLGSRLVRIRDKPKEPRGVD